MHNHEHEHCYHELKYCSICDKVYCPKCGKEWGTYSGWNYTTIPWCGTTFGNSATLQSGTTLNSIPDTIK